MTIFSPGVSVFAFLSIRLYATDDFQPSSAFSTRASAAAGSKSPTITSSPAVPPTCSSYSFLTCSSVVASVSAIDSSSVGV